MHYSFLMQGDTKNILLFMPDKSLRVLHVDDEYMWRSTLSDYLTLFGSYQITSAVSGKEALFLLQNSSFDVIVSDYQMPEMNGMDLFMYLRKKGNTIPFILFTGMKNEDFINRVQESGIDFYVGKTGDPSTVFHNLNQKIIRAVKKYHAVKGIDTGKNDENWSSLY